ncbi:PEGA domain-containing protein [Methanoplanus sp. FWC-SCC4]|uniref:PEGA domain-containing protein n=1 Tax=Methanochimaera problematica TaxID=2609417 RepID=A0AA97FC77_9EURY|nr:PEGA domain-containing protein [Methanoplanus sp. FWC-SCC4]WOF15544.1 PEGA domain-containing protein [Methanoplanus sp. FWC-SCC4]
MSFSKALSGGILLLAILAVTIAPGAAEQPLGNQIGWLTFHTNVDGATIYVNGNPVGTTVNQQFTYTVYLDGSPSSMPSTAYAAKSGYQTSNTVSVSIPGAGQTVDYYFTLNPSGPTTGSLYVDSSPTNAQVYVDGNYVGITPHSVRGLSTGKHNVEVIKSGYQNWASSASVVAGSQVNVFATLIPVNDHGTISIASSPSGATIYLDGNYKGLTPSTISGVTKGAHVVELNKAGYNEWSGQVNVYPGQTTRVSETLTAIPSPSKGSIYVSSTPGGAYIYLDGSYEGVTPYSGTYVIGNVPAGTHTISLKLSGYKDAATSVSVSGGGTATVSLPLTPVNPPAGTGTLDISSTPTGANVYINNEYKGITPFQLSLPAGEYSVSFRLTGYMDSTTTATVNSGGTSTVQGSLVPTTQPTQSGTIPFAAIAGLLIAGIGLAVFKSKRE